MADLRESIKGIWLKGMEAIGNTASNIASNTKSKVDEMNLVNRRADILREFGNQAYALWQKGEKFPQELASQLQELEKLDEQLNDLRAERLAGVKLDKAEESKDAAETLSQKAEAVTEAAEDALEDAEDAAEAVVKTAEEGLDTAEEALSDAAQAASEAVKDAADSVKDAVPVIQVENTAKETETANAGLNSAISDLFEQAPASEVAEKVNSALDSLGEGLKEFSDKVDAELDELSDKLQ